MMADVLAPTQHRLVYLDVMRGFAVLGILLVNIYSFALPTVEFYQPNSSPAFDGLNRFVWGLTSLLAEWKFLTLFSLLFGAGVWLFAERLQAKGEDAGKLHFRRCRWLLVFGLLHGYLLWEGDILFTYALCAMVVWPLRHQSLGAQFGWALAALAVCSLFYWGIMASVGADTLAEPGEGSVDYFSPAGAAQQIAVMRGGWLGQLPLRAEMTLDSQLETLFFGWRVLGLMLLGMVLIRAQSMFPRPAPALLLASLLLGLALTGWGLVGALKQNFALSYMWVDMFQYHYWGSLLIALAYAGGILYWSQSNRLKPLQQRLAAVGRTAFSCYILQTLICTSLFYGHGLGLYAYLDRLQLMGVVISVWGLLLWLAPWWLARFHYGPLEWLWRGLTYRHWSAFRRVPPAVEENQA